MFSPYISPSNMAVAYGTLQRSWITFSPSKTTPTSAGLSSMSAPSYRMT